MVGVSYSTVYRACKDIIRSRKDSVPRGENHPKYKGGHIDIFGYRVIWVNSKPIREHRHLMEQYIGRKLKRCEYVHHKDEDPLNNNLNNLEVISAKDHTILHHKGKQSPLKGRKYPIGHYSKRVCVKV